VPKILHISQKKFCEMRKFFPKTRQRIAMARAGLIKRASNVPCRAAANLQTVAKDRCSVGVDALRRQRRDGIPLRTSPAAIRELLCAP
jgi:hypothetical protein